MLGVEGNNLYVVTTSFEGRSDVSYGEVFFQFRTDESNVHDIDLRVGNFMQLITT
jgi:hypothetical protein